MNDEARNDARTTFLVERYWPGVTEPALRSAHGRLGAAIEALRREGVDIVQLRSALAAGEDAVFSFFSAHSSADVAEANRRGAVPFDRIVPVIDVD